LDGSLKLNTKSTRHQVVGCDEWAQYVDGCPHCVTGATNPQTLMRNTEIRKAPKTESFDSLHSFHWPVCYCSKPTNSTHTV